MKKNFLMLATAFALSMVMVSCDNENENNAGNGGDDNTEVVGPTVKDSYSYDEIEGDVLPTYSAATSTIADGEALPSEVADGDVVVVSEGAEVTLDGGLHVKKGGIFVVEPGVKVVAQNDVENTDYIFVEQGGVIIAEGTADSPIVMTSTLEEKGAWGGIHICGAAPINSGTPSLSEIESLPYGGNNAGDNSGVLKYLRVEYTGYSYSADQECNGVSFYGVGAGTTVEYVQAYHGSDDGFEFFGGTVNIKHCVATSCSDDSFDWTDGWVGKAQFIIAYHESDIDYACDCLLECDNNGSNNIAIPTSHPVISNATLVGYDYEGQKNDGVMLKAGTEVEIFNSIITGAKANSLVVKTDNTDAQLLAGKSILSNNHFSTALKNSSDSNKFTNEMLEDCKNATDYVSALTDNYFGTIAGATTLNSDFFEVVSYAGAVSADNDWTAGWVR